MTIQQKIFSKLEPHAKRIQDGDGNDFDYLPAVLLQLIEGQNHQARQLEDTKLQLQNTQSTISEQIAVLSNSHAVQVMQTTEGLSDIGLQIKSLANGTQRSYVKFTRLLIAGLAATIVMIGLAIALLQRH